MPAVDETIDPTSPGLAPRPRGVYDLVLALFCSLLLISNIAAVKLIQFGGDLSLGGFQVLPLVLDGGALLFPLTYVLGDVLADAATALRLANDTQDAAHRLTRGGGGATGRFKEVLKCDEIVCNLQETRDFDE